MNKLMKYAQILDEQQMFEASDEVVKFANRIAQAPNLSGLGDIPFLNSLNENNSAMANQMGYTQMPGQSYYGQGMDQATAGLMIPPGATPEQMAQLAQEWVNNQFMPGIGQYQEQYVKQQAGFMYKVTYENGIASGLSQQQAHEQAMRLMTSMLQQRSLPNGPQNSSVPNIPMPSTPYA